MIEAGAGYEELLDLETDGQRILESLLGNSSVELQFQLQLREGHNLSDTAVGKTVQEEFA